jgi:hypothetical protein
MQTSSFMDQLLNIDRNHHAFGNAASARASLRGSARSKTFIDDGAVRAVYSSIHEGQ